MMVYQAGNKTVEAFEVGKGPIPRWFASRIRDRQAGINPDGSVWFHQETNPTTKALLCCAVGDFLVLRDDGRLNMLSASDFHARFEISPDPEK
jgi:hypothetical protein